MEIRASTIKNCRAIVDRRYVCRSIAGLATNAVVANIPVGIEQKSSAMTAKQGFLIVNGWVLTREDVAARDVLPDVV
jgi:hypothetical protein